MGWPERAERELNKTLRFPLWKSSVLKNEQVRVRISRGTGDQFDHQATQESGSRRLRPECWAIKFQEATTDRFQHDIFTKKNLDDYESTSLGRKRRW